jgi:protein SCO1/2
MFLVLFGLAAVAAAGALFALNRMRAAPGPPDIGPAPEFTLTRSTGEPFSHHRLEGDVWMVNFFFTRCRGICPLLTERMGELQERLADREGWKLVSITVDPEFDIPEVLAAYAEERGADPDRWIFLTGGTETVHSLIREGFLLPVQRQDDAVEPVLHSSRILVIDAAGRIAGAYDALDEEAVVRLHRHVDALVPPAP